MRIVSLIALRIMGRAGLTSSRRIPRIAPGFDAPPWVRGQPKPLSSPAQTGFMQRNAASDHQQAATHRPREVTK